MDLRFFSLMVCLAIQYQVILAEYEISIEFLGYKNPGHRKADQQCCDTTIITRWPKGTCMNGCDTEFLVCLKHANNQSCIGGGFQSSGNIGASDDYVFHGPSHIGTLHLPNPIYYYGTAIPINGFQFQVKVMDKDYAVDELIDNIIVNISNHPINSSTIHAIGTYNRARLILAYKLNCFSTFYGSDCSTQCIPQEDHYTCDTRTGKKHCMPGYQNPALNCTERSCKSYCNTTGGACVGETAPVCKCHEGWEGVECSTPICSNDCDKIGGYCSLPGECKCRDGWTGENCNNFLCSPQCSVVGGRCSTPGGCECWPGYTGINYLRPCHRKQLCYNGGNCTNVGEGNYTCSCQSAYTGSQCTVDVDECHTYTSPCEFKNNFFCQNYPGGHVIICLPGWTGPDCCENIDDCSPNPCVYAESCIDAVAGYFCSCRAGYEGLNCESLVSHCVPNPCLNNGTCSSRDSGYLCHCSENYIGGDCHLHRDRVNTIGVSVGMGTLGIFTIVLLMLLIIIVIGCIYRTYLKGCECANVPIRSRRGENYSKVENDRANRISEKLLQPVTLPEFMNEVAAEIPNKWRDVAMQMISKLETIEGIEQEHNRRVNDYYAAVFNEWAKDGSKTWIDVLNVLRTKQVNEESLATKIETRKK